MLDIPNLQKNIILAPYTTYKIGGPADYFVVTKNQDALVQAVIEARKNKIPYFILGTGANILFGDKGFRGLIIKNEADTVVFNDNQIIIESGATIADVIRVTATNDLSGFEHFAGIPSTIGGAIWQNLHFLSPDRTRTVFIEEILISAKLLDENNKIVTVDKDFFEFGYDHSILHTRNLMVIEATFQLQEKSKTEIEKQIEENLHWRNEKQPQLKEYPSCGSVFKKIENVGAGRLIEQVGLKGHRIGNIQSSLQHANFLVNLGNGTAADVVALIKLIQKEVKEKTGYVLETEISFIGDF